MEYTWSISWSLNYPIIVSIKLWILVDRPSHMTRMIISHEDVSGESLTAPCYSLLKNLH